MQFRLSQTGPLSRRASCPRILERQSRALCNLFPLPFRCARARPAIVATVRERASEKYPYAVSRYRLQENRKRATASSPTSHHTLHRGHNRSSHSLFLKDEHTRKGYTHTHIRADSHVYQDVRQRCKIYNSFSDIEEANLLYCVVYEIYIICNNINFCCVLMQQ